MNSLTSALCPRRATYRPTGRGFESHRTPVLFWRESKAAYIPLLARLGGRVPDLPHLAELSHLSIYQVAPRQKKNRNARKKTQPQLHKSFAYRVVHRQFSVAIVNLIRMQRNAIAFAVDHDGAKTERSDGMFWLDHSAAIRRRRRDCIVQSPVRVQVNHRTRR